MYTNQPSSMRVLVRGWARLTYRLLLSVFLTSLLLLLLAHPGPPILHQHQQAAFISTGSISHAMTVSDYNQSVDTINSHVSDNHFLSRNNQSTITDNHSQTGSANSPAYINIPALVSNHSDHVVHSRSPVNIEEEMGPRLQPFFPVLSDDERNILMELAAKVTQYNILIQLSIQICIGYISQNF